MNKVYPTFIISAEQQDSDFSDNAFKTDELKQDLNAAKLHYKVIQWVSNENKRTSFVVEGSAGVAYELCSKYNQESSLVLDEDRYATVLNNDGSIKSVGRLHAVDKEVANKFDSYLFDGRYYWVAY